MNGITYMMMGDAYNISGAAMIRAKKNETSCITILPATDICCSNQRVTMTIRLLGILANTYNSEFRSSWFWGSIYIAYCNHSRLLSQRLEI